MARKKKKMNKKSSRRIILFTFICLAVNFYIFYTIGSVFKEVEDKKKENVNLSTKLVELKEKSLILKNEVNKLQNSEYVARYAREKFLYSKKDEYILKIDD